jgi:hypothetical protein
MDLMRKTALVAIPYLITFISVATLTPTPVLKDPAYILSPGGDTGLRWGALIEVIVALAGIGTAITLYPVVRRQNETFALGFVTSRVIEGAMLLTGVVSLLSLASLHQVGAAAGADSTALHQWRLVRRDVQRGVPDRRTLPAMNASCSGT